MRHVIFARPVAACSRRMIGAAVTALLVTATGFALRDRARFPGAAFGAINMAAIAMAADQYLDPAAADTRTVAPAFHRHGRGHPRPAARPQADAVDAIPPGCDDAPAFVLRHGVGHGADANCHVGIGAVPAFPIPEGLPHHPQIFRGQTLGRSAIPDCPGGSTGTSRPVASLRAKGAPRRGRVPPMDYLDNPERRPETQPSDYNFGK